MRKFGIVCLHSGVALVILLMFSALTGVMVVRSGWFHERVRERIVSEIERATGGSVELGSFSFDTLHLVAKVGPLVLHGREPAGDIPFLQVPSVTLGLRIISVFERKVDLASMHLEHPRAHIVVYADDTNNVPVPRIPRPTSWAEDLINFSVHRYDVVDGLVEYEDRAIPLNLRGENLQIRMAYEPAGPRYRGELTSRRISALAAGFGPVEADASAAFTIDTRKIEFSRLRVTTGGSRFDLAGALENVRAPHGSFSLKATVPIKDAVQIFPLPLAPAGNATFDGHLSISFQNRFDFGLSGRLDAHGIGYARDRLKIQGAEFHADLTLFSQQVTLRGIKLAALGTSMTGQASLTNWRDFHFEGEFDGLSVREAATIATDRPIAWSGMLRGNVAVTAVLGEPLTKVQSVIEIAPAPGGTPVEGHLDVSYDEAANSVSLGSSYLATPATRVDVTGTLGATLAVRARSTNLEDLMPALAMASDNVPKELPLKLLSGNATFVGTVAGALGDPRVAGQVAVAKASFEDHVFDRFSGDGEASAQGVRFQHLALARGTTTMEGSASITPKDGAYEDGAVAAQLNLRNVSLAEAAKETGLSTAIAGTAFATVRVTGSVKRPEAEIKLQVEKPSAFGEQADRISANLRYSPEAIEVTAGQVDAGPGKLRIQGDYRHPEGNWHNGDVRFDLAAEGMAISRAQAFSKLQLGIDGKLDGKIAGTAHVVRDEFSIATVNGDVSARTLAYQGQTLGDLSVSVQTHGTDLAIQAKGQAKVPGNDASFQGEGSWRLEGDDPGTAKFRFSRMSIATLRDLAMTGATEEQRNVELPFEGSLEGSATVAVSLRKPQEFHAELTIDPVEIRAKPAQTLRLGVQPQDVALKNAKPVSVAFSSKEARIGSAQFTARDTSLEVSGGVLFNGKPSADLAVRGSVNLSILQLLSPDLLAQGNATVQASVRGTLQDPQLSGRMELKKASLYLNDLPNGVDNANGAVSFDRNRATIEKLTAESGGGTVSFSGFVEFGSVLVYRLQAQAQKVRVRYEDIGITLDAGLALNGTPDSSTVSGVLTLTRATVSPRADLGQLLASAAKPVAAPESNDYLRGMQFDVRVESAPNFELQTSLTHDVETEVDLRIRGTPLRPALLGTVSVDQGEVELFGNRYTIDRGDIRFTNPVKVEPAFDVNLETKARGINVNISVSGTLQKLKVNYSSDPPLQSREIIALLAVGRAPSGFSGLTTNTDTSGASSFADAGGGLLSQAVTAQLTSRLQRFFGASRVKIDPSVNSVDYLTPQAHLTLEQQVSKDITLTYITNLNRTQEQTVQVEWDISQRWSAIAVRDANGLFGIDFQYRKRFK